MKLTLRTIVAAMVISACEGRAFAAIIGLDSASEDATVVWDGSATVATSNNIGILGTSTSLYSTFGLRDPSELEVLLTLTGVPSVGINRLGLLVSRRTGTCAGCVSITDALQSLGLRLPAGGDKTSPIIPFFASLIGPSTAVNGDIFRLAPADQAALASLLLVPGFGPDDLVVGLSVDSVRVPIPGGGWVGSEVFTVQVVPEPASLVLMGWGLLSLAVRRRRPGSR